VDIDGLLLTVFIELFDKEEVVVWREGILLRTTFDVGSIPGFMSLEDFKVGGGLSTGVPL
jgi:hypothetical protein